MTDITIWKTPEGKYRGFECNGHADFAAYGKDVVCAALSVLTINTINSIDQLTDDRIDESAEELFPVILPIIYQRKQNC